jgi:hypothetical protein
MNHPTTKAANRNAMITPTDEHIGENDSGGVHDGPGARRRSASMPPYGQSRGSPRRFNLLPRERWVENRPPKGKGGPRLGSVDKGWCCHERGLNDSESCWARNCDFSPDPGAVFRDYSFPFVCELSRSNSATSSSACERVITIWIMGEPVGPRQPRSCLILAIAELRWRALSA